MDEKEYINEISAEVLKEYKEIEKIKEIKIPVAADVAFSLLMTVIHKR